MSGEVIYKPTQHTPHRCKTPAGSYVGSALFRKDYPPGTIWRCNECNLHWKVDKNYRWNVTFIGPFKRRMLRKAREAS